ncbi:MAG: PIG-L family deacetylase [Tenacibaculum sp.]
MNNKLSVFLLFLLISLIAVAQKPKKLNSSQIYEKIQKLNFLGSALYIAAHPDDENTRLIAYLANHQKAKTAYLSLTRGDGGQNLIGSEIRELLGVIRTQELLAAREIDGGEQLFTRANDFGYSKNPEETLKIWDKQAVLADVVWAIRNFKPDVIINRFDHRTSGNTHGHHSSSALLSVEAFDLAADATKFPEQLNYTTTWKPKRLFFNTSWWFYGSEEKFAKLNKKNMLPFDVGVYYPLKGLSNNELASMASSKHLCQGFGRLTTRGRQKEWLELLKGAFPKDKKNIFSGIDTSWNRVEGGSEIGKILHQIEKEFNFINPSEHLSGLLKAYKKIKQLKNEHWKKIKIKELKEIIEACAGLYLEASANSSSATPNSKIKLHFEVLNRSNTAMKLSTVEILPQQRSLTVNLPLSLNKKYSFSEEISIGKLTYSEPYWLSNPWSSGMYKVSNQSQVGKPESERPLHIKYSLNIENQIISFVKPVVHRYAKKDQGEIYEPFEILPQVTAKLSDKVMVFDSNKPRKVKVILRAGNNNCSGTLLLKVPKGWKIKPKILPFSIEQKGNVQMLEFTLSPTKKESAGLIKAVASINGNFYDKELVEINYSHIPKQSVLLPSQGKVVRLNLKKEGNKIAYIQGSGDAIPENLRQIGYEVIELNPAEINEVNLSQFQAVVLGIRAYNTQKVLAFKQNYLLDYVKNGGNLLVQYNTSRGVNLKAPYELRLSRNRVADQNAKVSILEKNHDVLNHPNKITKADFENWVQERGLYFADKWSKEYTPILSMNDKGEKPMHGSLLIAKYGKGNYIYTGLSFFRELPAGVSGAYKLFANLLSLKSQKQ